MQKLLLRSALSIFCSLSLVTFIAPAAAPAAPVSPADSDDSGETTAGDIHERLALVQQLLDQVRSTASIKDKVVADFFRRWATGEKAREIVELSDLEWALRQEILRSEKKGRVALFLNRHAQTLKMAAIALIALGGLGYSYKSIQEGNEKRHAEQATARGEYEAVAKPAIEKIARAIKLKGFRGHIRNRERRELVMRALRKANNQDRRVGDLLGKNTGLQRQVRNKKRHIKGLLKALAKAKA